MQLHVQNVLILRTILKVEVVTLNLRNFSLNLAPKGLLKARYDPHDWMCLIFKLILNLQEYLAGHTSQVVESFHFLYSILIIEVIILEQAAKSSRIA